jgi:cell wall-associated NlpC family hydrolase
MRYPSVSVILALLAPTVTLLAACATAPPSDQAFTRDWANDQRRSAAERQQRNQRLFVFGQEVRTPEWLDTDERGRPELRVGETENTSTAISVDRGELGLRHRWGGNRNNLPAPPGFDSRGNPTGGAEE